MHVVVELGLCCCLKAVGDTVHVVVVVVVVGATCGSGVSICTFVFFQKKIGFLYCFLFFLISEVPPSALSTMNRGKKKK